MNSRREYGNTLKQLVSPRNIIEKYNEENLL